MVRNPGKTCEVSNSHWASVTNYCLKTPLFKEDTCVVTTMAFKFLCVSALVHNFGLFVFNYTSNTKGRIDVPETKNDKLTNMIEDAHFVEVLSVSESSVPNLRSYNLVE